MKTPHQRTAVLVMILAAFIGCATKTATTSAPVTPTPPQMTVASAVNALAQALDGAVTSAIAARDQGKVSAADVMAIETLATVIATTGKQVDAELRSSDPWVTQKAKILQTVSAAGIGTLKAKVSPAAQALISTLVVIVNEISSGVGGPVL